MSDLIQHQFKIFHDKNPQVYSTLEKLVQKELANDPYKLLGIKALFEKVRWEIPMTTFGEPFKLNNNYHSRYVRLLIERHPEWSSNFHLRALADA